jgi:hypothetical protein
MDQIEGGYVGYDCRPGDVIKLDGANHKVLDTFPGGVRIEPTQGAPGVSEGRAYTASYNRLQRDKAYYVARLIPCRAPEGETR